MQKHTPDKRQAKQLKHNVEAHVEDVDQGNRAPTRRHRQVTALQCLSRAFFSTWDEADCNRQLHKGDHGVNEYIGPKVRVAEGK